MSVTDWAPLPSERSLLYSPIGLRLVDDFTGRAPLGRVSARLDRQVSVGVWAATDLEPVLTPSNVLIWPGLGRQREPHTAPTRRYRARVEAGLYRPQYLEASDGVEFDAPSFDDGTPPNPITAGPQDLYLLPAPSYGFPTWVRVMRGRVEDAAGAAVANVLVQQGTVERVLTDDRGVFALPLRWAATGAPIDASDARTGRTGSHALTLPTDLQSSVTITIV